ncbi:MAG: diguanylate cyclase [Proteobacteria bacterium]|jgi:two-component system, cell cycle response regulator|nr:diguanylate cyclase [Pseudomonadota bacterium]
MRILIAEDEPVARMIIQRALEVLNHECVAVEDGLQAWRSIQKYGFDVVISDLMMPDIDGFELCRRVRKLGGYTYFILLTGVSETESRLKGMEAGADDYLTKPLDVVELRLRLIAAERLAALHTKISEQKWALEALNKQLFTQGRMDALTNIPNRLRLQEDLEKLHARLERHGHAYGVALMDVDHFKKYNDTCGHLAGDEALKLIANTLARTCRATDWVYRYGGEEFVAIFPDTTAETVCIAAERMRAAIERLREPHPGLGPANVLTVSIGVSWMGHGGQTSIDDVLNNADLGLYEAKNNGRNLVRVFPSHEEN